MSFSRHIAEQLNEQAGPAEAQVLKGGSIEPVMPHSAIVPMA